MTALRLVFLLLLVAVPPAAFSATLLEQAAAAETALDTPRALALYTAAHEADPQNAFILQKIARQYSDLVEDPAPPEEKRRLAQTALQYSQRAVQLAPTNPVNVLSLAVSHGKLAAHSDTRAKVQYSRLIREEAERALQLVPNYAWAHHVLGRWHYEVATLSGTARLFVRMFYGGLPAASTAEAIRHLERAVALEPGVLAHHLELGFAYLAADNPTAARQAFATGLALPPREKHDANAQARARTALAQLN